MEKISAYKNQALASLKGNWGDCVIITLIYCAIKLIFASSLGILGSIFTRHYFSVATLLILPLDWGYLIFFLNLARKANVGKNTLFDGFMSNQYVRLLGTILLYSILVLVGLIILIIPGIILMLMFSQFYFVMKDNPELKYMDALKMSAKLMKGHLWQFFLLNLSFIGWGLLAMLTFGIGWLWLAPYIYTTCAHYYEDLKSEYEAQVQNA